MTSASQQTRHIEMFYSEEEVFLELQRNNIEETARIFEGMPDELIDEYRQRKP